MPVVQKAKSKGRKIGRNARWCEAYRLQGKRMKNKIKKLRKHIKNFTEDKQAKAALKRLT